MGVLSDWAAAERAKQAQQTAQAPTRIPGLMKTDPLTPAPMASAPPRSAFSSCSALSESSAATAGEVGQNGHVSELLHPTAHSGSGAVCPGLRPSAAQGFPARATSSGACRATG